jgi:Tfp pilus assembly protein PilN
MSNQHVCHLNLASRPVRNRRLFHLLVITAGASILILSFVSADAFFRYGAKASAVKTSLAKIDVEIKAAKSQTVRYDTQIKKMMKESKKRVDAVNGIIAQKSFSWVNFLSALEKTLPNPCYITSMAPSFHPDASMDVRLKVVSPDLDTLMTFIDRLLAEKFQGIRLLDESRAEDGNFLYELSVRYERTL